MNQQNVGGTSGDLREALVILRSDQTFTQVFAGYKVNQAASDRVGVIELPSGGVSVLTSIPGVTVVTGGDLPPGIRESLDEGEALFVDAWLSRNQQEAPAKQRRGEGLSWDTPGFLPPDPPAAPADAHAENQDHTKRSNANGGRSSDS